MKLLCFFTEFSKINHADKDKAGYHPRLSGESPTIESIIFITEPYKKYLELYKYFATEAKTAVPEKAYEVYLLEFMN